MLGELAGFFSGTRLACAGCGGAMRPLRLRGVVVDLCFACGGLWLDRGELSRLSGGRHAERDAAIAVDDDVPVVTGALVEPPRVVLGRGSAAVLLASASVDASALREAFARTDGLTSDDADAIAEGHVGVVVHGVADAGAAGLVDVLASVGVGAHVVDDAVLRLPPAVPVTGLVPQPGRPALRASHGLGPPSELAAGQIVAVAWAVCLAPPAAPWERAPPPSVVLELVADHGGGPPRRLRLARPGEGVDDDVRAIVDAVRSWGGPVVHLSPLAGAAAGGRPRPRTLRDVEWALAVTCWRARRQGRPAG
jgi:hypothetical protein